LEEILSLSDRILVLYEGQIVAEFPPDVSEEAIGIAMLGAGHRERAA
jgi:simple sugar transport system ATP-binding protein